MTQTRHIELPPAVALAAALLALAATFAAAPALAVGQGRLIGQVNDETGAPLAGVKVVLTTPEISIYRQEKVTDGRGQFTLIVLDATRQYRIHCEKEGYVALEQPLKIQLEETTKETYVLRKAAPRTAGGGGPAQASGGPSAAPPPPDPGLAALKAKNEAIAAYNAGVGAVQAKDFSTAAANFEKAAGLDPTLAPAQAALAEVYLEQGKKPEALAAADRYLALAPGNPRGLQVRYDALKAMGDRERAGQALAALTAGDHSHDTAVRVFNEGAEALRAGNLELAVGQLNRALDIEPNLDAAYSALANIHLSHKHYKEALSLADRWLAVRPGASEPLTVRYQALAGLKDPRAKEAQAAMQAAKSGETPEAAFNHGVTLYNSGSIADATTAFEEVVKAKPAFARAHYLLGLCYANANNVAKAKEHLQEFLRLAPNDADAPAAKEMLNYLH